MLSLYLSVAEELLMIWNQLKYLESFIKKLICRYLLDRKKWRSQHLLNNGLKDDHTNFRSRKICLTFHIEKIGLDHSKHNLKSRHQIGVHYDTLQKLTRSSRVWVDVSLHPNHNPSNQHWGTQSSSFDYILNVSYTQHSAQYSDTEVKHR